MGSQEMYGAAVDHFAAPLLFTLPSEQQQAVYRTPLARHTHSPLRDSGTISSARRSVTPPGSVHTDTTPPRPPPIMRLQDSLMTGDEAALGRNASMLYIKMYGRLVDLNATGLERNSTMACHPCD